MATILHEADLIQRVPLTSHLSRRAHDLAREAVGISDKSELFSHLTRECGEAVKADRAFLALVHEESGELVIHTVTGEGWTEERRAQRLRLTSSQGIPEPNDVASADKKRDRRGITGYVALTGKTYLTGNVSSDPYHFFFFEDAKSEIAVPLIDNDGITRGVLNMQSVHENYFNEEHARFLETIASLIVMRLLVERYRLREVALVELGKDLSAVGDTGTLMRRVVDVAADILRFEDCSVFVLTPERTDLVLAATRGPLADEVGHATYPLGEGLTGWVAKHGETIRCGPPVLDPRWQGRYEEMPSEDIGAFLAVPIHGRSSVLGVLRVLRRKSNAPWFRMEFSSDDESVLLTIASQIGSAIENSHMLDRLVDTERMAAWGEMSAKAAHMIGNRTFAVKGHLNELEYLLSEKEDRRDQFKQLAASIRVGIFRLEEILQEFRDFVRATQITLSDQDLNEILKQCVAESFPPRSSVELKLNLAPDLPYVPADPARLKRAFSELIENAMSFMPEGGTLTISSTEAESSVVHRACGLTRSRKYVSVVLEDSGPGVPETDKERIFTPFYTSRAKGMGLGLSIVKGILEAHHGCIIERGAPGRGATFVTYLPARTSQGTLITP